MAKKKELMPSLLDREISSADRDAFGHRHFAAALEALIESPRNVPPYSIGLLGKWGTGKSSIKELYLASLEDDHSRNEQEPIRAERIRTITFNAWRFGGENIKRALLRHVFLQLEGNEAELKNALFNQVQSVTTHQRSWRDIWHELLDRWGWALLQVIMVYLIIVGLLAAIRGLFNPDNEWVKLIIVALSVASAPAVIKYLLDPKRFLIQRYSKAVTIEPPSSSAEEYEDLLVDQISKYKDGDTPSREGRKCERLVVFVDDLDRLSADEMVSGLEAVRTFMDIPRSGIADLGIVFVISCDEERVADALANRNQLRNHLDLPGTVFNQSDARRFLDRIFQFRIEIPPFPKQDMRSFVKQRLSEECPEIVNVLDKQTTSLDAVIDRLIHVDVQSPRNALQLLNTFVQCWWLAQQRERDGAGTERSGGLQEGSVTNHPIALAALCSLRVDFPDFYSDLQREPELIKRFTDVFIRGKSENQPAMTQSILSEYAISDSPTEISTEHQPLRQYIASLQGLRWPPTLQPLLLLSQDAVTRRFGDRALRLYETFVSGDYQGVLAALGRDKDAKPLPFEDIRLIESIQEELYRETDVRQNNAASAVAALADRLPESQAPRLLSPLSRRLAESPELRWRLGVPNIRKVLIHTLSDDRREVAGKLIEDLLRREGDIGFQTEHSEVPSLDEAVEMVREACDLALWVKHQDGLDEQHLTALLDWLGSRRVATGQKEHKLPYREFENWVSQYEDHLLSDLGSRYTDLLAAELEADNVDNLDAEAIGRRVGKVFESLWQAGGDSHNELWTQLKRYVSVSMEPVVELSWKFVVAHKDSPDVAALTAFVAAFARRLAMGGTGLENWEDGARALLDLVEPRQAEVGTDAHSNMAELAIGWSSQEQTSPFAVRLQSVLHSIDLETGNRVVAAWADHLFDDLPGPCINWLSEHFASLDSGGQQAVVEALNQASSSADISEDTGRRFQLFMGQLPEDGIKSDAMQQYLQQLLPRIQRWHNNPDCLYQIFPAIPRLVEYAPSPQTGNMLQNLFVETKNTPSLYGWLHGQMVTYWLDSREDLNPYNPSQLFEEAVATMHANSSDEQAHGILQSVCDMVQRGIVAADQSPVVIQAAFDLWPHHGNVALRTFRSFELVLELPKVADLMDSVSPDSGEEIELLSEVWSHMASLLNLDQRIAVAKRILGKPLKGIPPEPDLCLRLWIEAQDEQSHSLLQGMSVSSELNDEQYKRIWLQIERVATSLGVDLLSEILHDFFGIEDIPETHSAIFGSRDTITAVFTSISERHVLGESLLRAFLRSSSQKNKNQLAEWLRSIDGEALLGKLNDLGAPSNNDIDTLEKFFPKSKYLKQ